MAILYLGEAAVFHNAGNVQAKQIEIDNGAL